MRFRKTFKIAPGIKLNVSKSGLSTTLGGKGFSVNTGSRGTYLNTGIPGTGIYSRSKIGRTSRRSSQSTYQANYQMNEKQFESAIKWVNKKGGVPFIMLLLLSTVICFFVNPIIATLLLVGVIVVLIRWVTSRAGKSSALILKARKAWVQSDSDKMLESLEKAYDLYPNPELADDIAFQAQLNEKYILALKYLPEDETDVGTAFSKAECHFALNNYEQAAKYFGMLASLNGTDAQTDNVNAKLGISLHKIGEHRKALEHLQKVTTSYENQSELALLIGNCFIELGEKESGIFAMSSFIGRKRTFDLNMLEMCYTIGNVYLSEGEKTKAKQWLNKVYTQDVGYKDAGKLLASLN